MNSSLFHRPTHKFIAAIFAFTLIVGYMAVSETSAKEVELSTEDTESIMINAENGEASNQYAVGILHQRGESLPLNPELAVEWYRKSADQGYAPAEFSMGMLYDAGFGVAQNDALAFEWYRKAANQGLPDAQYNLAAMYDQGRGIEKNFEEAARWYELSARQGYANAQINLASMYTGGDGVPMDFAKAYIWASAASKSGDVRGQQKIDWLISNKMSDAEVEKAKNLTAKCLESSFVDCDF